jgi:NAD-dependent deacetylase
MGTMNMKSYAGRINRAAELIKAAERVVAFSGAGISTESGISDFRSPGGIWERYRMVTYQEFLSDQSLRKGYWRMKAELFKELMVARPNDAHSALAKLEKIGKLRSVITQNIDGLHQDGGSIKVIEIHGTNRQAACMTCGKRWPIEEVHARLEETDYEPLCDKCGGFVKPATISFGQPMPEKEMSDAFHQAANCDLFLMIGSSLQVEPAASIPREARRAGAELIFINRTETHLDSMASVLFQENAGKVLADILSEIKK